MFQLNTECHCSCSIISLVFFWGGVVNAGKRFKSDTCLLVLCTDISVLGNVVTPIHKPYCCKAPVHTSFLKPTSGAPAAMAVCCAGIHASSLLHVDSDSMFRYKTPSGNGARAKGKKALLL